MNKRTKFLLGIGVIAALVIGWQVAAFAVHDDGVFELDGNADNQAVAGDDWDLICRSVADGPPAVSGLGCTSATGSTTAIDTAFIEEEPADASSIFTGGGSKDPSDIPSWKWKDGGGLPDKDNLLHAFAATYNDSTGDELLYFGSDRFDNSGDAVQGFWFFQNEVNTGGTPAGTFNGTHADGDLLVLSDFSNGGTTATIAVYEWQAGCNKAGQSFDPDGAGPRPSGTCGDDNLFTLASSNTAKCPTGNPIPPLTDDRFCGIVNPGTITLPWTFNDKTNDGGTNKALNGEFYEAGLNLTDLGLGDRCFSSIGAESRSSTSTTAVLKDFIIGRFGNCTSGLTTTPSPSGPFSVGDTVHDTAALDITGTSTWSGTLDFFVCSPTDMATAGTTTCEDTVPGTAVGSVAVNQDTPAADLISDDVTLDEPGTWCFRGVFTSNTDGVPDSTDATEGECVNVTAPSSVDTTQTWLPNDSATVTAPDGTTGTVTFTLYNNGTCDATNPDDVLYTEDVTGDSSAPFATNNTDVTVDATSDVSWQAHFVPDAGQGVDPSTNDPCETTSLTITN